jgi:pilus assembly protein Flp/PilA
VLVYHFHLSPSVLVSLKGGFKTMLQAIRLVMNLQIWKDRRGQDLVEYALMAGFVAVAAGALMPGVASSVNVIFSAVNSIMLLAASS